MESVLHPDPAWARDACAKIHRAASAEQPRDSQCVLLGDVDEFLNDTIGKARGTGRFQFHFQLRQQKPGEYALLVQNWQRKDSGDFESVGWTIRAKDDAELERWLTRLVQTVLNYESLESDVKTLFLAGGLGMSRVLAVNAEQKVIDTRTGAELSDEQAYRVFIEESPKNQRYMRAAIEVGIALGFGALNYWKTSLLGKDPRENINYGDWDYLGRDGQIDRWRRFKGLRNDNNSKNVNISHSYAGAAYYTLARSNQLSSGESFLYTFAASALWESVVEYREVISINDMIITPVGGFVIGEVLHQFGRYFWAKGTVPGKLLSSIFDAPSALNRLLDGGAKRDVRPYGFNANPSLNFFDFFVGAANTSEGTGTGKTYGVRGELFSIPLYEDPGMVRNLYTDTVFSQLVVQNVDRSGGLADFQAFAKVVFGALHQRNIGLDEKGRLQGYSFMLGLSSAGSYDVSGEDESRNAKDWIAAVHVLGSTLDVSVFVRGTKIRFTADVFGDFAMIHSYAFDAYRRQGGPVDGISSVMANRNYYYGFGVSGFGTLQITQGPLTLGYRLEKSAYDAMEGRSRYLESLTRELNPSDARDRQEVWLEYQMTKQWKARVSFQKDERSGSIVGGSTVNGSTIRKMGTLHFAF